MMADEQPPADPPAEPKPDAQPSPPRPLVETPLRCGCVEVKMSDGGVARRKCIVHSMRHLAEALAEAATAAGMLGDRFEEIHQAGVRRQIEQQLARSREQQQRGG